MLATTGIRLQSQAIRMYKYTKIQRVTSNVFIIIITIIIIIIIIIIAEFSTGC